MSQRTVRVVALIAVAGMILATFAGLIGSWL